MRKRLIDRWQAGDTIVEVLLVLTILSLSFAISYATANGGLRKSRNAEEHSQALGILSNQVELVRTAVAQKAISTFPTTQPFCMTDPADVTKFLVIPSDAVKANANEEDFDAYPPACVIKNLYAISVSYVSFPGNEAGRDYFEFRVRWPGAGPLGVQSERMSYKMPILSGDGAAYENPPIAQVDPRPATTITHVPVPGSPNNTMNLAWTTSVRPGDFVLSTQCQYDLGAWFDCDNAYSHTYPATGSAGESHTFSVRATSAQGGEGRTGNYTWNWVPASGYVDTSHDDFIVTGGYFASVCWDYPCEEHTYWYWVTTGYWQHVTSGYYAVPAHWQY
jgi:type II secretory pathway pseudopilin PulG